MTKHIHLNGIPGLEGEIFLERHSQMILSTREIVELIEAARRLSSRLFVRKLVENWSTDKG